MGSKGGKRWTDGGFVANKLIAEIGPVGVVVAILAYSYGAAGKIAQNPRIMYANQYLKLVMTNSLAAMLFIEMFL